MTIYLLGLDGASLSQVRALVKTGRLPNFEKVLKDGTSADLRSVYPYVTAPAWSSLFSGVNPGKHGLFDQLALKNGVAGFPNMRHSDVPFLWDYVSKAGKKILAVGIPFVHPVPQVNGAFVSGRFVKELSCFPPHLERSFDLSGFDDIKYHSIRDRLHRSRNEKELKLRRLSSDLRKRLKTSQKLIESEEWDMVAVVDGFPDEFLHIEPSDEELELEMFSVIDSFLGVLASRMNDSDSLLLVSDHGFTRASRVLFIKKWLISKKYVPREGTPGPHLDRGMVNRIPAAKKMSTHVRQVLSWNPRQSGDELPKERQDYLIGWPPPGSLVMTLGTQNLVWLRFLQEVGPRGGDIGTELISDLEELRGAGFIKKVYRTSELYRGKYTEEAPGQLLAEPADNCVIDKNTVTGSELYSDLRRNVGRHHLDGLLVTYGSARMEMGQVVSIYDVLPTLLRLLRLPTPDFLDGKPLPLSI